MQLKDVLKNKQSLFIVHTGFTVPRGAEVKEYIGKARQQYNSHFVGRVLYPQAVKVTCLNYGIKPDGNLKQDVANIISKHTHEDNPSSVLVQDVFTKELFAVEARQILGSADPVYAEWGEEAKFRETQKLTEDARAQVADQVREVCNRRSEQLREDVNAVLVELFGKGRELSGWNSPSVEAEITVDADYKPVIRYKNSGTIQLSVDDFYRLVERIDR
jgi:hypothetical protein